MVSYQLYYGNGSVGKVMIGEAGEIAQLVKYLEGPEFYFKNPCKTVQICHILIIRSVKVDDTDRSLNLTGLQLSFLGKF